MESLTIFEAGTRTIDGNYTKLIKSQDKSKVIKHLEMARQYHDYFELVLYEKTFHCVSTTPHIYNTPTADKNQINAEQKALNDFVDLNMVY
jgi:hypothetical protein